ncbi:redoxin domain-containing protein [Aneurinibacillus sp. REN35]|uniref:redoxin domain-containing protein n=1 Tax=Aneurinibacillus sp. REN35 TaxID=3237286 RepID=UPI00352701B8
MKNIAALLVLFALVGGVLYGTMGKKETDEQTPPTAASSGEVSAEKAEPAAKVGVKKGNLAPDFTLDTLDGKTIRLSELRGKTVIMNIWATWCPPCRKEIPDMVAFYEKAKGEQVEILAVNLTETESSIPNVKRFVEGMEMQFPILLDKKSKVANLYEATVVPTSIIIDKDGIIQDIVTGPMTQAMMKELVAKSK